MSLLADSIKILLSTSENAWAHTRLSPSSILLSKDGQDTIILFITASDLPDRKTTTKVQLLMPSFKNSKHAKFTKNFLFARIIKKFCQSLGRMEFGSNLMSLTNELSESLLGLSKSFGEMVPISCSSKTI